MNKYRPEGWKPNPCDGCKDKEEDEYGLYCNIVCGKATAHASYEAGADAILKSLLDNGVFTYGHHTPDVPLIDAPYVSGYWCFIPEEQDEENE